MFDWLKQRLVDIVQWFADLFKAVFSAAWDFVTDVVCWIIDKVLDLVISIVSKIDMSGLDQYAGSWGTLPGDVLNVLGLLGIGTACVIIVAAAGIRFTLQLIPFTRLGS